MNRDSGRRPPFPDDPVVERRPRPQFGRRRTPAAPPPVRPLAFPRPLAFAPRPLSRFARRLGGATVVGCALLVLVFAKFTLPGLLSGLPSCDSDKVRTVLIGMVQRHWTERKLPFTKIEIAGAKTVSSGEIWSCRAAVHVDQHRPVAITYDISWSRRLIGEYEVDMRSVPN